MGLDHDFPHLDIAMKICSTFQIWGPIKIALVFLGKPESPTAFLKLIPGAWTAHDGTSNA